MGVNDIATRVADRLINAYTLYIGTNSKDGSGSSSYEETKQLAIDLALKYVGGYTIYDAQGGWTNSQGVAESEDTIVLVLVTDDKAAVRAVAEEMSKALNQEAILVQSDRLALGYYEGE